MHGSGMACQAGRQTQPQHSPPRLQSWIFDFSCRAASDQFHSHLTVECEMAEIVGAVLSVIELIGIVRSAVETVGEIRKGEERRKQLLEELQMSEASFLRLKDVMESDENDRAERVRNKLVSHHSKTLEEMKEELDKFEKKARSASGAKKVLVKWQWHSRTKDIDRLIENVEKSRHRLDSVLLTDTARHLQQTGYTMATDGIDKILGWLTTTDYTNRHCYLTDATEPGTGQWFLESIDYVHWSTTFPKTLLCTGIPGAGKTFLAAAAINDICKRFEGDADVCCAYVYCDDQSRDEQTARAIVSSLLGQLSQRGKTPQQFPQAVRKLYQQCKKSHRHPNYAELFDALISVIGDHRRVFLVFDALDECRPEEEYQHRLLEAISALSRLPNVSILATSRPVPLVSDSLIGHINMVVYAHDEDVRRYVHRRISQRPDLILNRPELENEVIDSILSSTQQMYAVTTYT